MIASLVLATFICSTDVNNADKCEVSYAGTWKGVSEYHKDKETCLTVKNAMFPNDVVIDKDDNKKFTFAGCYRVLPGEWVNLTLNAVYLQNVEDADDSFIDSANKFN